MFLEKQPALPLIGLKKEKKSEKGANDGKEWSRICVPASQVIRNYGSMGAT